MKIRIQRTTRNILLAICAGGLTFFNVSCTTPTSTASGSAAGSADDFYADGSGTAGADPNSGEYDNIYDGAGGNSGDDYYGDSSTYDTPDTPAASSGSDYNSGGSSKPAPSYSGGSSSSSSGSSTKYYTVKRGDNLFRIGKAHGVSWTAIQSANNLPGETITPGQRLIIPR